LTVEKLVAFDVAYVARFFSLSTLHQASNVTLFRPVAGVKAERKHDVAEMTIRTKNFSRSEKKVQHDVR
jgi:hypothetical protein